MLLLAEAEAAALRGLMMFMTQHQAVQAVADGTPALVLREHQARALKAAMVSRQITVGTVLVVAVVEQTNKVATGR